MPLPRAEALGIRPPSFELDLQMDGSNSTKFYITSDGLEGQLIVGMEDLPFRVDPPRINMTRGDVNLPVELIFYGNETLEPGVYEGKVTFLAYTGGFVAMGIKIRAKINLLGEAQEIHEEEPETPVAAESEEEPEAETEQEPEPEAETESESEEEPDIHIQEPSGETGHDINVLEPEPDEETDPAIETYDATQDAESAEEPEPESQEMDYTPYLMGGAAVAALISVIIWWKRR